MNWRLSAVAASMVLAIACGADSPLAPGGETPAWLSALVRQLQAEPVANPPAFVARYEYGGAVVYYVPARWPDGWSDLYAIDGTVLCHPDGGITGRGDGRCPDFLAVRRNERIIWRDSRTR